MSRVHPLRAAVIILASASRIYAGTALLGLTAETAQRHLKGSPEPLASGTEASGTHSHGHHHGTRDHQADADCGDNACSPGHITLANGRLSVRHAEGGFAYVLNSLGGAAAAWEGRRLGRRMTSGAAAGYGVAAGALAAIVHAGTHLALERDQNREQLLRTVTSPCHIRLLGLSIAGAAVGTRLA